MSVLARLFASLALLLAASVASAQTCQGKFPNPITDVCWRCVMPLQIGGTTIMGSDQETSSSPSSTGCFCQNGANIRVGVMTQFWEPSRVFEMPRAPFCFPTLGGIKINTGLDVGEHGRMGRSKGRAGGAPRSSFYHAHWYQAPWFTILSIFGDNPCLETAYFDIAYMTEVDPSWSDDEATAVLNADVVLFANPVAQAACMVDCVTATAGFPLSEMFWCAGCAGSMYPLTGNVAHAPNGLSASLTLMQRLTNKLHRQGQMWNASGDDARCGYSLQPLMDKRSYKSSMLYPRPQRKVGGRCCSPYGRSEVLWGAGVEVPALGEDFSYQIFRKRTCCTGISPINP